MQEPKLETVSVLAKWNLKREKEQTKKKKIHWSDYDLKVVYLEEANPTRNVMQRGEAHQILPIFLSRPGEWKLDRVPRRIGTAQCVQTSEGAIQDHKSLQSRAPNNLIQKVLFGPRCAEPLIKSKDRMYIVDNGASLHVMEVNSFTLQQEAAWKFKPRTASSVPPKSERFTSRSWWKSLLQYCPLDDCTMSWDTPTRGNQENAPKFTKWQKTIECCTEKLWYSSLRSQSNRLLHLWIRFPASTTPPTETLCPKTKWRR